LLREKFNWLVDAVGSRLIELVGVLAVVLVGRLRKRLLSNRTEHVEVQTNLTIEGETRMLEGQELAGNIGSIGKYAVDIQPDGHLELSVGVKIDLLHEIEKLAAKTGTQIDDNVVAFLKKLMGRE
jgi:hypothetical protein